MKRLRAYSDWILLALVALVPRLWQLDRFITPDEILFLNQARHFLEGLAGGDLLLTLGIGYPGVTLAWGNALGLLGLFGLARLGLVKEIPATPSLGPFLAGVDVQPLPYYVAGRVVTALLATVLLLLVYTLARRLFAPGGYGRGDVALISVLLLSLDPYLLGYSRLMHIATPLALLMLLTVMAWLLWLKEEHRRWLWLTGLFSGLAILTKTTGMLLLPTLVGLSLLAWVVERPSNHRWWYIEKKWMSRRLGGWIGVVGITALIFCVLWPAMWRDPGAALGLTFDWLWFNKDAGQGNLGMFWMGRFVEDPGPTFYLVALLLKLSPLMFVGLIFSLPGLRLVRDRWAELGLWAYAIFYLLVMAVATKKSVRYLLPAIAAFAPLAAYGILRLGRWAASAISAWRGGQAYGDTFLTPFIRRPFLFGLGLLLLVVALVYAPYYFSYYNPMLVGWRWAPKTLLVGWGEGLGDAARYLNQRPGAEHSTVAAWYDWTFAPFFVGQTLPFSTENAMRADYSVVYINQVQRNIPDPNLITYFGRRVPEYVVRLNGIDYVWVYPAINSDGSPPDGVVQVGVSMGEAVVLEGYVARSVTKGHGLIITLYWRALESDLPDYSVYVRAVDGEGQIYARADSPPVMGFWPTSRWEAGKLVADEQVLLRPPETEPGAYRLEVGMYDPLTWAVLEPTGGERGQGGGLLLGEVNLP
jgi:4-amino-4-deoxy-L-arabinose transferase-like glycosyltransferase